MLQQFHFQMQLVTFWENVLNFFCSFFSFLSFCFTSRSVSFWKIFQVTMRRISHYSIPRMVYEHHHVVHRYICQQSISHLNRVSVVRACVHACTPSTTHFNYVSHATLTIISLFEFHSHCHRKEKYFTKIFTSTMGQKGANIYWFMHEIFNCSFFPFKFIRCNNILFR